MYKTIKIALLAFLIFTVIPAVAQRHFTVAQVSVESDVANQRYSRGHVFLNLPLLRSHKSLLFFSPSAEILSEPVREAQLGGFASALTWIRNPNAKWSTQLSVVPRWNDLQFQTSNLQLGGAVLISYRLSDSLKLKAGMYYNREYFGDFFVPLFGIDYKINSRTFLYGTLPGSLTLEKTPRENFSYGLNFRSFTGSYITGARRIDSTSREYIRLSESKIGVFAEQRFASKLFVRGELGHSVTRNFRFFKSNAAEATFRQKPFFINLGISYKLASTKD